MSPRSRFSRRRSMVSNIEVLGLRSAFPWLPGPYLPALRGPNGRLAPDRNLRHRVAIRRRYWLTAHWLSTRGGVMEISLALCGRSSRAVTGLGK
jgi:hypothetical protein